MYPSHKDGLLSSLFYVQHSQVRSRDIFLYQSIILLGFITGVQRLLRLAVADFLVGIVTNARQLFVSTPVV